MKIENKFIVMCVGFTLVTLVEALFIGDFLKGSITYLHLVSRFAVTTIAIGSFFVFDWLADIPQWIANIIHYSISMCLIFALVYITGKYIEPLSPSAYIDAFKSFTSIYMVVAMYMELKKHFEKKKSI